jgi:hypothetical protein
LALFDVHGVECDLLVCSVADDVLNAFALEPRRFLLSVRQGRYHNLSKCHNTYEVLKQGAKKSLQGLMLVRNSTAIPMCRPNCASGETPAKIQH